MAVLVLLGYHETETEIGRVVTSKLSKRRNVNLLRKVALTEGNSETLKAFRRRPCCIARRSRHDAALCVAKSEISR